VQGQLRKKYVSIEVETMCNHCDQEMHLKIDSNMQVSVYELDANPLVFIPDIDWKNFAEKTIIDSY
jgi:hypothetical protein